MNSKLQSLARGINQSLRPFGIKIANANKAVVEMNRYIEVIKELYGCFTTLHNFTLPVSPKRLELMAQLMGTQPTEAMYILMYLSKTMPMQGDVCEFGIAQGLTSALIANEILPSNKNLWLFDSFQGLPKPSEKDKLIDDVYGLGSMEAYQGQLCFSASEAMARVKETAFPTQRLKIIPGFIEETIKRSDLPAQVCFAYVDFDFYEPIKIALEFLAPRLPKGGVVIIDDYGWFSSGAQTAVDEFMSENSKAFEFIVSPSWASRFAIIIKEWPHLY